MDALFDAYSEALPRVRAWVDETFPTTRGESEAVRRRAVKAKALDLLRGLLPAASLSHMGIYATGQAYEQLILHLLAHPLPEARVCGERMLEAVKAVIPSFVSRVERPGRGDVWVDYLSERRARRAPLDRAPRAGPRRAARARSSVGCARRRRRGRLLAALLFEAAGDVRGGRLRGRRALSDRRARADARRPRRRARQPPPPPGPRLRGAALPLRDRLRLRRLPRPPAPPHADRPVAAADAGPRRRDPRGGRGGRLRRPLRARAGALARRVRAPARRGPGEAAPYALCLGYRIRYVLDLNAREAMHLTELRSAREGHASYRAVAQAMHSAIARASTRRSRRR